MPEGFRVEILGTYPRLHGTCLQPQQKTTGSERGLVLARPPPPAALTLTLSKQTRARCQAGIFLLVSFQSLLQGHTRSLRPARWKLPCRGHLAWTLPPRPAVPSCPGGLLALLRFLPPIEFLMEQPTGHAGRGWCTGRLGSFWSLRRQLCGRTS